MIYLSKPNTGLVLLTSQLILGRVIASLYIVRAGRNAVGLLVVILYFYFFIGLQFRAGQTTMPCLHKALFVVGNAATP
jgi:hypothetical protein